MRDRAEDQIGLVFIRHGATASNREGRYVGKTDEPLSREGRSALRMAGSRGIYPKVGYVFSSPMKRCVETAGILYPKMKPIVIPEWEEMDFGAFEGKNFRELKEDKRYQSWIDSGGTLPFPEGESREEFQRRCDAGLHRMLEVLSGAPEKPEGRKTAGAVVHGGTIMALFSRYGGGDYFDYQVPNGEGYLCTLKACGGKIQITGIRKLPEREAGGADRL